MPDAVILAAFMLGISLLVSVVLLARDVGSKRLHQRLSEVRLYDAPVVEQSRSPTTIRLTPARGGRLTAQLNILLSCNPRNPGQNLLPWELTLGLSCLAGAFTAWHVSGLAGWPGAVVAFPLATLVVARSAFIWQARRYQAKLLAQIPETMDFISRGIRAGIPLAEALRSVSREIPSPSREVFQQVIGDLAVGRSVEESLSRLAANTGLQEYSFFTVVVSLQAQTGGSLYETLDNLGDIVRQRIGVAKRGKALASEARASAVVLVALPFLAALMMSVVRPGYLDVFFDERGHKMLVVGLSLLGTGMFVMREMMRRSLAP
jgi:tight adherence protein B